MAVETEHDTGPISEKRRGRRSSLVRPAAALPTVESSLEEFIAKANQTAVDVGSWSSGAEQARLEKETREAEDAKRREDEAIRLKATEAQLRDGVARESSMRIQLDGLQSKLAEAEARAAVFATTAGPGRDATVQKAEERARTAEDKLATITAEIAALRDTTKARTTGAFPIEAAAQSDEQLTRRMRIAEGKAVKALAAARAACAGLKISPADLDAIEDGMLLPPTLPQSKPPIYLAIGGGIAFGVLAMFAVAKLFMTTPVQQTAAVTPPPAPPAAMAGPSDTASPPPAPAAAVVAPAPAPTVTPTVTPIDDHADHADQPGHEIEITPTIQSLPANDTTATAHHAHHANAPMHAATTHAAASAHSAATPAKPNGGLADPFSAGTSAPGAAAAPAATSKTAPKKTAWSTRSAADPAEPAGSGAIRPDPARSGRIRRAAAARQAHRRPPAERGSAASARFDSVRRAFRCIAVSAALKTRAVRVTTRCLCFVLAAIAFAAAPRIARAEAPPSAADIEAAKKDFVEGKTLHDQGKLDAAITKFKDSYRLSRNPTLLYNIGFTLDEAGQKEAALFYYRKFLSDAPADAGQRATASDRVKVLEGELGVQGAATTTAGSGSGSPAAVTTTPTATTPDSGKPAEPAIKPAGTYSAKDFAHEVVDDAPPGKPLDLTATVPQDSGFTVTMYFRSAGDAAFTAKVMRWRYKELVARIPAAKMTGSSIQYYIEARDHANTLIARSGKATEPNLINLDATVAARNYPDFVDESPTTAAAKPAGKHNDEEDPLHKGGVQQPPNSVVAQPGTDVAAGGGVFDVGSSSFRAVKWSATGATVALLAASVVFYVQAGDANNTLQQEAKLSTTTPGCSAAPPCRSFDSYLANAQAEGKRDQTISRVTLGVGVAAAVIGGYYWYRQVFGKPSTESPTQQSARAHHHHDGPSWVLAPALGDGFTGAAAGATF